MLGFLRNVSAEPVDLFPGFLPPLEPGSSFLCTLAWCHLDEIAHGEIMRGNLAFVAARTLVHDARAERVVRSLAASAMEKSS